MAGFEEAMERLLTDAGFRARLSEDAAAALAGYQLSDDERALLSSGLEESGEHHTVEQRTSKAGVAGLLSAGLTGATTQPTGSDHGPGGILPVDGWAGDQTGNTGDTVPTERVSFVFHKIDMDAPLEPSTATDLAGPTDDPDIRVSKIDAFSIRQQSAPDADADRLVAGASVETGNHPDFLWAPIGVSSTSPSGADGPLLDVGPGDLAASGPGGSETPSKGEVVGIEPTPGD